MPSYTQQDRLLSITTPLGEDVLLLHSLTGHEGISQLFNFKLDLLSENDSIKFEDIVGQKVTASIALGDESKRYINGYISRFAQTFKDQRFTYYQAELVPWLWFLTRGWDCRIFQNMTVPEIIQQVFSDVGFSDNTNSLQATYEPREYCVQYRESHFNFVSRLMEQYGIFYYFQHDDGEHTLVLGDSANIHQPCPGQTTARYDTIAGDFGQEDVITRWQMEEELRTGKYSLADYNFTTPSTNLEVSEPSIVTVDNNSKYEIFDYPGGYLKRHEGQDLAKIRMQEEEAVHLMAKASSVCRAFVPGYKFDLEDCYRDDMNKTYLLTGIDHTASVGESYSTGETAEEKYSNTLTCIPADIPFRPPRVTPRPFVQGPQPAIVVGKSGEEIWVDNYGRIKVQFYWDRQGKDDENSSCWVRVSQPWAGKNWGAVFIPRIGQEVIVDFVEGDPDYPIITGRVYNAEQMPPGELPKYQNLSGFRTYSTDQGGEHHSNVLTWDDTYGKEWFYMRAQRNCSRCVEHDDYLTVMNNQTEKIGSDRTTEIGHDETTKIGHDKTLTVLNDRTSTIAGNDSETVMQSQTINIGLSQSSTIGTSQSTTVGGTKATNVAGAETHSVAGALLLNCGGAMSVTVGGTTMITSGGPVMITAPVVLINGVLVVTQAIVSPIYTPGLGNLI